MQIRSKFHNKEDVHDFLITQLKKVRTTTTFFVGAGISQPSHLPLSSDIARKVVAALCMDPELEIHQRNLSDRVGEADLKMEVLFEIIQNMVGAKLKRLFSIFEGGKPNLYHYFLSRLLAAERTKHVVTTNFDQLIEDSSDVKLNIFATESTHSERLTQSVFKIHGTVEDPDTIIAVLSQVSQGLSPNKRQLMQETLRNICIVIGWRDHDIDLTPLFYEAGKGNLIWFHYDPEVSLVFDFMLKPENRYLEQKGLEHVQQILERTGGALVACDPLVFISDLWQNLTDELGSIPEVKSSETTIIDSAIINWAQSLQPFERLVIVGDILRHIADWDHAFKVFEIVKTKTLLDSDLPFFYQRMGNCAVHLQRWDHAFNYFHLLLQSKGYQLSFEAFIDQCPEEPSLATIYGNFGSLLEKIGRYKEAATCYKMDMILCKKFKLLGLSSAYVNYAAMLVQLGEIEEAKRMANLGIIEAMREGNYFALGIGYSGLALIAVIIGDLNETEAQLAKAYECNFILCQPDRQVDTLIDLAQLWCTKGEFSEAIKFASRALEISELHNLIYNKASSWMTIGIIRKEEGCYKQLILGHSSKREYKASLKAYKNALKQLGTSTDEQKLKSQILNNRGLLYHLMTNGKRAYEDLFTSLEIRTQLLDEFGRAYVLNNLGLTMIHGGGLDQAEGFLQESLEIFERFKHKVGQCQVMNDLGITYGTRFLLDSLSNSNNQSTLRSYYQKAETYYKKSLELAKELQIPIKISQAEQNLNKLMDFRKGTNKDKGDHNE